MRFKTKSTTSRLPRIAALMLIATSIGHSKSWDVPMGGNSYLTQESSRQQGDRRKPTWNDPASVTSVFFRVDRPAELALSLKADVPEGESRIRATVGDKVFEVELKGGESQEISIGEINVPAIGYVRLDLQGAKKSGPVFANVEAIKVTSKGADAEAVELNYVKDNESNRYYWGRRGPSVHLGYTLPKKVPAEYFYNEITVPEGSDPIGSYFMSNGFGEGYFGMQVNSPTERRVLFSVWSPFVTDRPAEIPDDQKITLVKKGEGVHGGEFGGEGSGGQSYWLYPWKAGSTYKFLNRVHPDGAGSTVYTAWFYVAEKSKWQLIASFKRPQTDKHLTRPHSFLENFADRLGYLSRRAVYGNQWSCDINGDWHELTEARFTCDDIGNRSYRLDFTGGNEGDQFFMKNGGFFAENTKPGSKFLRPSNPSAKPVIDLKSLE